MATLTASDFSNSELLSHNFQRVQGTGTTFRGAKLDSCQFANSVFVQANFTNASLVKTAWQTATLTKSNLANTDLTRANLHETHLTECNVEGANFFEVTCRGGEWDKLRGLVQAKNIETASVASDPRYLENSDRRWLDRWCD